VGRKLITQSTAASAEKSLIAKVAKDAKKSGRDRIAVLGAG